jgi:hypothetical protein
LIKNYNKLPSSLEDNPLDNWFNEEKLFIFYLDSYWGRISKEIQLVNIIQHEIEEVIEEDNTVPESIKKSTERMVKNAPTENDKQRIMNVLRDTSSAKKVHKIESLLEKLEELMDSDTMTKYRIKVREKIKKSNATKNIEIQRKKVENKEKDIFSKDAF